MRLLFRIILAIAGGLFLLYLACHLYVYALWLVYSYNFLIAVD